MSNSLLDTIKNPSVKEDSTNCWIQVSLNLKWILITKLIDNINLIFWKSILFNLYLLENLVTPKLSSYIKSYHDKCFKDIFILTHIMM
jgi:hypothetical protein